MITPQNKWWMKSRVQQGTLCPIFLLLLLFPWVRLMSSHPLGRSRRCPRQQWLHYADEHNSVGRDWVKLGIALFLSYSCRVHCQLFLSCILHLMSSFRYCHCICRDMRHLLCRHFQLKAPPQEQEMDHWHARHHTLYAHPSWSDHQRKNTIAELEGSGVAAPPMNATVTHSPTPQTMVCVVPPSGGGVDGRQSPKSMLEMQEKGVSHSKTWKHRVWELVCLIVLVFWC